MSEYVKRVVTLITKTQTSAPFTVYVKGELPAKSVVQVRTQEEMNPATGEVRMRAVVSGDNLVVSHDPSWLGKIASGFINKDGYGVITPLGIPSVDEVLATL